jgi:hypothetical protein
MKKYEKIWKSIALFLLIIPKFAKQLTVEIKYKH